MTSDFKTWPRWFGALSRSPDTQSWVFIALVCLSVFGLTAWRIEQAYYLQIEEGKATTANLARSLADQAHGTVHAAETIIGGVTERLENDGLSEPAISRLHRLLVKFVSVTPGIRDVIAFSAEGNGLVGSLEPLPRINVADRAYFITHRADPSPRALVGLPIQNRADGRWSFTVSRRVTNPDGSFGGIVVALIDCETFSESYRHFDVGPNGTIWMINEDATLIARQPPLLGAIGKNFAGATFVTEYRERGPVGSSENVSSSDGKARLSSYRKVDGYPLVMFVSLGKDDLLSGWRSDAIIGYAAAAAISAVLGLLGWQIMSQGRLRNRADLAIRHSDTRYKLLADHSTDVIMQLDADGRREYVSPASERILGYQPLELMNVHPRDTTHPDDWPRVEANFREVTATGQAPPVTYRIRRKDGVYLWVETQGRRLEGGDGTIVAVRDVSQRKRVEGLLHEANNHLQQQVMLDGLTGIANRRAFDLNLQRELKRAARSQTPLGLLVLDVDHFKAFNDRYGHQPGDTCLRAIAQSIAAEIRRPADFVARYGGEEFVVLLPDTDEAGSAAMAERVRAAIERLAIEHAGNPGGVATVSIGVAVDRPQPGTVDGPGCVRLADGALYQAKAEGRNRVVHTAALQVAAAVRMEAAG